MSRLLSLLSSVLLISCLCVGTARAQVEPAPSQDLRDTDVALQWTTAGSMLITATLGTILAINKPTLFDDGRCSSGDPVLGDYGCHGLGVLHGISALISMVLFTATTTFEIDRFGWPNKGHGDGYGVASWISLVGMAALPIAGLVAAVPDVLGMDLPDDSLFRRVLRTLHLVFAYTTVGTYVATAAIDL